MPKDPEENTEAVSKEVESSRLSISSTTDPTIESQQTSKTGIFSCASSPDRMLQHIYILTGLHIKRSGFCSDWRIFDV
tara:strand:+ start:1278 stop:1511 length:234 start_codon:yes stop_codon:yes gene_type:complete